MEGGSGSSNSDPRFEFLGSFVQKTLKLKPEKWHRLVTLEEHKAVLKEFFDTQASLVLIIILTPSAQLIPIVSFPIAQLKNKGVYFVKKNTIDVPREGCKDCLVVGDLATRTIDQLSCLVDEIFVPLLSNSDNHQGWPEMVAQDVQKQVHSLKSTVYQVQGQVSGQTVLPMPVGVDKCVQTAKELVVNAECSINLYLKSAIEGVVIKWATQVNDVMIETSSNAFNGGQNPVPSVEINFWNNRLKNLTYIYEQLRHERIRSMALILEFTDSAYYPCFKTLFKNVVTALAEARDITLYLNPLTRHFQQLEDTEFSECKVLLKPLMHVVCLIWSNSMYYCHSAKLIVLLRQICNLIIQQAKRFLDPSSIFHTDIDEAMQRISLSIQILKYFRTVYDEYKDNIAPFFKERPVVNWTFHPNAVFERFNAFLERLFTIQWFFNTVIEFLKLEKVEIGGLKGRALSARITGVSVEFNQCFSVFASKTYDVLDPDDPTFKEDFVKFQDRILELDLKLAAILCQAFDDCHNLESVFKLISIVGTVLDRPKIREEFTGKYRQILYMIDEELSTCEDIFDMQMEHHRKERHIFVDRSSPPVTASLRWVLQLTNRITAPIKQFQTLQHPVVTSDEGQALIVRYDELIRKLKEFERSIFESWAATVDQTIEEHLDKPLIVRKRNCAELSLNFSPQLFAILREVHYLRLMEKEDIPERGLEFSEKSDVFRSYTLNLEKTVEWYNKIRRNCTEVELELIKGEIEMIDELLTRAINELTWNSEDITEYMNKIRTPVEQLQGRMHSIQSNLKEIRNIMSSWAKAPLFERKDSKKDTVLCLEERNDRKTKRYGELEAAALKVHQLLEGNMQQFGMEENQSDPNWIKYMKFVDNIVHENLLFMIGISMGYLVENMDPGNNLAPLFESRLELLEPELVFVPSLNPNDPNGFNFLLAALVTDITYMSSLIPRLLKNADETYEQKIMHITDIQDMKVEILQGVDRVIQEAAQFCGDFERYSYLWLEDREYSMEIFLEYGRQLEIDELEMIGNKDPDAPHPCPPTIEAFREQIDHYESLYLEIEQIEPLQIFNAWFQVDVRPFRQSLLNIVRKWGNMFKDHLVTNVTYSLTDLGNFIRKADEGLLQIVKEGDYDGLVNIMAYLLHVKERTATTDEMFTPMKETIELLKYYDMDIPEEVNVYLQELPEQWANTKKIAITVKQQVAPLQANEVVGIRNKIAAFDLHISLFRDIFRTYEFFKYDNEEPYKLLNRINGDMERLEKDMYGIHESGSLFEVPVPEFKLLKQCRKEMKMLKQLWDYVYIVRTSIEDWKTTPWRKVDVENMDIECKKFAKDIRLLDKEMRSWDTYLTLEATVKNMLTSLRAVGELQNPAIRERHWNQLMSSTKVNMQDMLAEVLIDVFKCCRIPKSLC